MECEEFILPDWSPPNDPARVLAAEGRRNPSIFKSKTLIASLHERHDTKIMRKVFGFKQKIPTSGIVKVWPQLKGVMEKRR